MGWACCGPLSLLALAWWRPTTWAANGSGGATGSVAIAALALGGAIVNGLLIAGAIVLAQQGDVWRWLVIGAYVIGIVAFGKWMGRYATLTEDRITAYIMGLFWPIIPMVVAQMAAKDLGRRWFGWRGGFF